MLALFRPSSTLTEAEVNSSLRLMVWDGMAGASMFAFASGGFMAAFALALGANNLQIGVLAALPFVSQGVQLPAILMVERFRRRKALGIPAWYLSNLMWIPVGAVPFLMETPGSAAVFTVMFLIGVRGIFAAVWGTSWLSWMSDLVPQQILGNYYGRRLAAVTATVAVVSLSGSFFVRWWTESAVPGEAIYAYSFLLIGGALTLGIASPTIALMAKEPLMPPSLISGNSVISILTEPLRDRNFTQLVRFLFLWSFASNLAIPFFAVYMLTKLELTLPAVIGFTVLSQLANILFVRVWGPFADRMGSKTVLSLAASLYLLVIIGWTFTTLPGPHALSLPLLAALHVFAGVAAAGVTLTMGTLALKVAPEGKETPFLGVAGIATNVGAGVGPIVGGLLADYFAVRSFRIDFSWASPGGVLEFPALSLTGFDFLFVIAFLLGFLSLNILVALREEGEVARNIALAELTAGSVPLARAVSSVPGLNAISAFSVGGLKRVPGGDVALGVTAYQLAASTKAAVAAATRSHSLADDVAGLVGGVLREAVDNVEDAAGQGLELARHATRGAIEAGDNLAGRAGELTRGVVVGTVRTLAGQSVDVRTALRGAGYGTIQGTARVGEDLAEAVGQAIQAAREISEEFGLPAEDAETALVSGVLRAAEAEGQEALATVREAVAGISASNAQKPADVEVPEERA